jgi:hypothetical protein
MHHMNIIEWEMQNWTNKIQYGKYELYNKGLDTTFCLVNTNYPSREWNSNSMRLAGSSTFLNFSGTPDSPVKNFVG